jgi:hypothetical protein
VPPRPRAWCRSFVTSLCFRSSLVGPSVSVRAGACVGVTDTLVVFRVSGLPMTSACQKTEKEKSIRTSRSHKIFIVFPDEMSAVGTARCCALATAMPAAGVCTLFWWWWLWSAVISPSLGRDHVNAIASVTKPPSSPVPRITGTFDDRDDDGDDDGHPPRDELTLETAQAAVRDALRRARGERCAQQRMPLYVSRVRKNYNFGDEMNIDVGAALLNMTPRCVAANQSLRWGRRAGSEPNCAILDNRALWYTTNSSTAPKWLMIGSILKIAAAGDLVTGSGIKGPLPIAAPILRRLRSGGVRFAAVRGPRTCAVLRGSDSWLPQSCPISSDPALLVHVLPTSFMPLRRSPASRGHHGSSNSKSARRPSNAQRAGGDGGGRRSRGHSGGASPPPLLCVVPHIFEPEVTSHALRESTRAAEGLREWFGCLSPAMRAAMNTSSWADVYPHWQHTDPQHALQQHARCRPPATTLRPPPQIRVISPRARLPLDVARKMLACDLVISSALHGIILADALRIPSLWLRGEPAANASGSTPAPPATPAPNQHPLKYEDYLLSIGEHRPERATVRTIGEAVALLRAGRPPPPRLALSEILQRAITFIRDIFPFGLVSSSCGGVWGTVADRGRGVFPSK